MNIFSVLDIDVDVVPVSLQLSESIDIRWVFKGNTTYNITSYTVYWCWKTLSGKCQVHCLSHVTRKLVFGV